MSKLPFAPIGYLTALRHTTVTFLRGWSTDQPKEVWREARYAFRASQSFVRGLFWWLVGLVLLLTFPVSFPALAWLFQYERNKFVRQSEQFRRETFRRGCGQTAKASDPITD